MCEIYRYGEFRQLKFECDCCEILLFRVCGAKQNFYVCSLYRTPDVDDRIYKSLPTAVAAVQVVDVSASFLFIDDLNGHHQESLDSTTTNRHGVDSLDFGTVSGCDQLVIGPTHARGCALDLLNTDVPDLVQVAIASPLGSSYHSSLLTAISMAQAVPNLCVSIRVLLN